jgi:hypothetical protein
MGTEFDTAGILRNHSMLSKIILSITLIDMKSSVEYRRDL